MAPMLKQASGWAQAKFVCFNRQKLADGMLKWQNSNIHTSLTNLPDKQTTSVAVRLFKNILGFMGDKVRISSDIYFLDILYIYTHLPFYFLR